jgi:3-deoxy-D-manno-octulosonic-acid transferase
MIDDADRLTAAIAALLNDPNARDRVTQAARATVESLGGALDRTLQSLDPYLVDLLLRQRGRHA